MLNSTSYVCPCPNLWNLGMTLKERVFADILWILRQDHLGLGWNLNPTTNILKQKTEADG